MDNPSIGTSYYSVSIMCTNALHDVRCSLIGVQVNYFPSHVLLNCLIVVQLKYCQYLQVFLVTLSLTPPDKDLHCISPVYCTYVLCVVSNNVSTSKSRFI